MRLSALGEFGLIRHLAGRLALRPGTVLGIGDDAALLQPLQAPVVTCDALVEDVHFRRAWTTPRQLGHKAIAVNVSDIAAMGGLPVAAVVAIALCADDDLHFVEELYAGFEEAAALYGLTIAGGDTVRSSGKLLLSVTVVGSAVRPILRSDARAGDVLVVTGTLGDAAAALALLQQEDAGADAQAAPSFAAHREFLMRRHHLPAARLQEMQAALTVASATRGTAPKPSVQSEIQNPKSKIGKSAIRNPQFEKAVRAALDLSDGLAGDAAHLAERSGVSIEIDVAALPISAACRAAAELLQVDPLEFALRGGEDYELLLCVQPDQVETVRAAILGATGTATTAIGRCIDATTTAVLLSGPNKMGERAGGAFTHF